MFPTFKIGDCLETTIERIAFGGDGVGRVEGVVVFVPFTAEGDRVRVQLNAVKKNYLRGKAQKILEPSPFRVDSQCRYYAQCGGCQYQHIDYRHQLQIKKSQIIDAFQRIGRMKTVPIKDCIPSPQCYGYRGKAEFHAGIGQGGRLVLGFMPAKGNDTIDIDRCEILDESINQSFAACRDHFFTGREQIADQDLVFWSDCRPPEAYGGEKPDTDPYLLPDNPPEIPIVTRLVKGRTFVVPHRSFFQANMMLIDRMVDEVIAACELTGSETVLDCFSGSGLFSLFIAGHCRTVFGVEIDPDAVFCASANAKAFGHANVFFYEGFTQDILRKFKKEQNTPDLIILDPPRTGCDPGVVAGIMALAPDRIVYISCDPATQARDILQFTENGYQLQKLQPIDMFPQTKHIEVIAVLRK